MMHRTPDVPIGGGDNTEFEVSGDLVVKHDKKVSIRLDHETGGIFIHNDVGDIICHLEMPDSNFRLGGNGRNGDLILFRDTVNNIKDKNEATFHLDSDRGVMKVGGKKTAGKLVIEDEFDSQTLFLDGEQASILAGANGKNGSIFVQNANNIRTISLNGSKADIAAGGDKQDGDLFLRNKDSVSVIHLDGGNANITAGGDGQDSEIFLRNKDGKTAIHADAGSGRIDFSNASGIRTMRMEGNSGNIRVGGAPGVDGDIIVFPSGQNINIDDSSQATIHMNGNTGDIILRNADCAEDFNVVDARAVQPGTVMVLNEEGLLQLSHKEYDKRVVGVVSGAGNYRPGIVLDKQPEQGNREPIALMGKVFCRVTAEKVPIEIGDLLTTSGVLGHAMKATDTGQAFGTIIGKALASHFEGEGLIPILVYPA